MKRNILKNLGAINVEEIAIMGGQIEVFVPEEHPEVVNVAVNVNLVFTMVYANPEFALQIVLFDEDNQNNFEEYDDSFVGDIELSEEQRKQIKKAMWDKLGEYMLNL